MEAYEEIELLKKVSSMMLDQLEKNTEQTNILLRGYGAIQAALNNLKYELSDPEGYKQDFFYPKFRSNEETLRLIVEEGKSLARFGDGEFDIVFQIPRHKFQRPDERLAERIKQVLNSEHPDLLIGIAKNYGSLNLYNENAADGIRQYMTEEVRQRHRQLLSADRIYSDAYMTRPYIMHRDLFTEGPQKRFNALKRIWKSRKIMIVEGAQTRLGVRNDLFEGAASVKRILAPAANSFDKYEGILRECFNHAEEADLFILAIGPSSGVLAYDLTCEGYQAVDVGHIDLEYEWFLAGKGTRVSVPYKYNNEVKGGDQVEEINDPAYEASVVAIL